LSYINNSAVTNHRDDDVTSAEIDAHHEVNVSFNNHNHHHQGGDDGYDGIASRTQQDGPHI